PRSRADAPQPRHGRLGRRPRATPRTTPSWPTRSTRWSSRSGRVHRGRAPTWPAPPRLRARGGRPGPARQVPWQTRRMPGVRIVTDSACDLTDELVQAHRIGVVPLTIRFGEEELEDRRQLSPETFWERCKGKGALPETAAPSPGSF